MTIINITDNPKVIHIHVTGWSQQEIDMIIELAKAINKTK